MMNEQNFARALARSTAEERRAKARRAGQASGKRRRERRTAREAARDLLALPLDESQKDVAAWLREKGMLQREHTQMWAILLAMHRRALSGDIKAAEVLFRLAGEWPADKSEVTTTEKPSTEMRYDLSHLSFEQLAELTRLAYDGDKLTG